MKSNSAVRNISQSALLSYVCFNPLFRATRLMRKRMRRNTSSKLRYARLHTA